MTNIWQERLQARRVLSGVRGDWLGSWTGRVTYELPEKPSERAVKRGSRMLSKVEPAVVRWMFVEAAAKCRSTGTHRMLMSWVADMREDSDEIRRDVGMIGTLTQLLVKDSSCAEIREVAESLLDADFAKVWQVGLWSNLTWRGAWEETKRLQNGDMWEMIAALCRNTRCDDLAELEGLAQAVLGAGRR